MRKMGNAISCTVHAVNKLHPDVRCNEILGFDRKEKVEIDGAIREEHPEGDQYAEHGSRCPEGRATLSDQWCDKEVGDAGTNSTDEIIGEKFSGTPDILQLHPEHPECEHIEKQMPHPPVQKKIGEQLPWIELTAADWPEF